MPNGVCGCLLVSEGANWCRGYLLVSESTYWCLRVLTCICGRLLRSDGTDWYLRVPTGA